MNTDDTSLITSAELAKINDVERSEVLNHRPRQRDTLEVKLEGVPDPRFILREKTAEDADSTEEYQLLRELEGKNAVSEYEGRVEYAVNKLLENNTNRMLEDYRNNGMPFDGIIESHINERNLWLPQQKDDHYNMRGENISELVCIQEDLVTKPGWSTDITSSVSLEDGKRYGRHVAGGTAVSLTAGIASYTMANPETGLSPASVATLGVAGGLWAAGNLGRKKRKQYDIASEAGLAARGIQRKMRYWGDVPIRPVQVRAAELE